MKFICRGVFWFCAFTFVHSKVHRDGTDLFPDDFLFGVASSSYQVEGGWNEGGKSMSVWDYQFHVKHINEGEKCWIDDCSDGDVGTDSYHQYKRDVQMLIELGVDHYRFSISWPRILPTGFANKINEEGVEYYNNLINELLENDIIPLVTIYHWELPQALQDLGGWANPLVADWFREYSRILFELFGDRVKHWITINEPLMVCQMGYGDKLMAPAIVSKGIGNYLCFKNLLLAHAEAYHLYDDEFRNSQNGIIGITINLMWYEPLTDSNEDAEAAKDLRAFENWPADPIFSKNGNFSERMANRIAERSREQGFPYSRLPVLTEKEVDFIHNSADFFGLNYYSTYALYRNASVPDKRQQGYNGLLGIYGVPSYVDDVNASMTTKPEYRESFKFTNYPPGFYKLLKYIQETYQNPPIIITENGYPIERTLNDDKHVDYLTGHLKVLKKAMDEGVQVTGYTYWSLMDSFEWGSGYTIKFGLYDVDFNDAARPRIPKKSAQVYADIINSRKVPV